MLLGATFCLCNVSTLQTNKIFEIMNLKLTGKLLAVLLIGYQLMSCSKSEEVNYNLSEGIGDILEVSSSSIKIIMDDADTVLITNASQFEGLEVDARVSFVGEIMSNRELGENKFYEFRAISISAVLTKDFILQSYINEDLEHRTDSIGSDPVSVYAASLTDKYINITYTITHGGTGTAHFMNLVVDDVEDAPVVENGVLTINAELRHNAFNDPSRYYAYDIISLRHSSSIDTENVDKIVFNISAKETSSSTKTYTIEQTIK